MRRLLALGAVLLLLLWTGSADAAFISIQPGSEGKDTWVSSGNPNASNANAINLTVGLTATRYALVEFDLSLVPLGSTVNSASLWLYRGGGANTLNVSAHEITSSWAETVTYNTRPSWNSSVEATAAVGANPDAWYSWSLTALTQKWVNDLSTNCGVLLALDAANGDKSFYSSDRGDGNAQFRPRLEIDYTPVPVPPAALFLGTGLVGFFLVRMRRRTSMPQL